MTTIEYAVRDLMLADASIVALLVARIFPAPLIDKVYPAITYQQISVPEDVSSHLGTSHLANTRLQLDLWATTYDNGITLRDNVRRVLRDYHGTVGTINIGRIKWANELSFDDPLIQIRRRTIDLLIWHYVSY